MVLNTIGVMMDHITLQCINFYKKMNFTQQYYNDLHT
jgi:hypothetical protein